VSFPPSVYTAIDGTATHGSNAPIVREEKIVQDEATAHGRAASGRYVRQRCNDHNGFFGLAICVTWLARARASADRVLNLPCVNPPGLKLDDESLRCRLQ
jgi:hypothetical protein